MACEVAADRVIAARASDSGHVLEHCSTNELAPGCVVPDLAENNLRQRNSVVQALRGALETVGARSRDVVAVVPDAAVPGPITRRLTEVYVKSVGCDFVQQYLSRLS